MPLDPRFLLHAQTVTRENRFIVIAILVFMANAFLLFLGISIHEIDSGEIAGIFFTTVPVIVMWAVLWKRWKLMVNTVPWLVTIGTMTFLLDMTAILLVVDKVHGLGIFWISVFAMAGAGLLVILSIFVCCTIVPRWLHPEIADRKYTHVRSDGGTDMGPSAAVPASKDTEIDIPVTLDDEIQQIPMSSNFSIGQQ